MRTRIWMSFILILVTSHIIIYAQIRPQDAVLQMTRGINLGNTLEPETEGAWNNGPVQEYYFDDYKNAGFQCVRIPVRWDKHTSTTSPYTIDAAWLNRVEQIVDWGLSRNLFIIINAHHEDWVKTGYATETLRNRFDSIWSQIAVRFQNKSEKLFFEMINEPNGMTVEQINDLNSTVLSIIRKTNPTRIVIYSGNEYSNSDQLMAADVPADTNIMGYFHSYDPWNFAGLGTGTWGTIADRSSLKSKFDAVKTWSLANDVPVLVGEFGAQRLCDYNSRMKHYAAYVEESINHGFAYTAWDDGGDFGIYQRADSSWNEIQSVLTNFGPESPDNLAIQIVNDTNLKLTWTNRVADCDTLIIERYINTGTFVPLAYISPDSTEFVDSNLDVGNYYYYRVIAYFADDTDIYSFPVRAYVIPVLREPYYGQAFTIPGEFEAEDYDKGGELLTFHDIDFENSFGDYRPDEGVDIEARTGGGYQIASIADGEWVEYTINVYEAGDYDIITSVASLNGGGSFRYTFTNGNTSNLNVPATGSWQTTDDIIVTRTLLAGEQIMRLFIVSDPAFNIDKISIQKSSSAEVVNSSSFQVFPSNFDNVLNIRTGSQSEIVELEITSILGKVVYSSTNNSGIQINTEKFEPGIYLIKIKSGNSVFCQKLIKN